MESVAIYCWLSRDDGDDAESNSIKTQRMITAKDKAGLSTIYM